MKLSLRITWLIFMVSLAILISLSLLHNQRFYNYVRYSDAVEHNYQTLGVLNNMLQIMKEAESAQRGFLLSTDSTWLHSYYEAVNNIQGIFIKLKTLTDHHEEQKKRVSMLHTRIQERVTIFNQTLHAFFDNRQDFEASMHRGKEKMLQCEAIIEEIKKEEFRSFTSQNRSKEFYKSVTPGSFRTTFFFTIVAFIISFFIITEQFRRRINYQKQLEQKIIELNQSNNELEQIAYLASHDLQEPLRKISTFSDRLSYKYADIVDEEGKKIIARINSASERMRDLVEDLAKYTTLIQTHGTKEIIDLNVSLMTLTQVFKPELENKNATVTFDHLPIIKGYPEQIQLLFECLLDNSLKFVRPETSPVIQVVKEPISMQEQKLLKERAAHNTFIKIVFRDNGIGFNNDFAERMFGIFRRLHGQQSEYQGKGVGLAIVKRVISNHNGFVLARGQMMQGAEFLLYFPVD